MWASLPGLDAHCKAGAPANPRVFADLAADTAVEDVNRSPQPRRSWGSRSQVG